MKPFVAATLFLGAFVSANGPLRHQRRGVITDGSISCVEVELADGTSSWLKEGSIREGSPVLLGSAGDKTDYYLQIEATSLGGNSFSLLVASTPSRGQGFYVGGDYDSLYSEAGHDGGNWTIADDGTWLKSTDNIKFGVHPIDGHIAVWFPNSIPDDCPGCAEISSLK
ncbi:hypothetical protein BT69DRAFT_1316809, partial [Atractiella rhizophila]